MEQNWFKSLKRLNLTPMMLKQLEYYCALIQEYNQVMNLTRIVATEAIYYKHFYDALLITNEITFTNQNVCDVGAGLGVPGLVLKICFPDINLVMIEANQKKCQFLKIVIAKIGLKNVSIINNRAELFAHEYRETFDIVIARALASLTICNELCLALVKIGGNFIAYKALNVDEEITLANSSCNLMGAQVAKVVSFTLPKQLGIRNLVIMKKIKLSPLKYPRSYQQIKNKPL